MNPKDLAVQIGQSLAPCVACGDLIDIWPEADPSEPGMKVIYSARDALFVGICGSGHINEFYLSEAKAGEYLAHDITERTLGTFTTQEDCPHKRHVFMQVLANQQIPSSSGLIVGPVTVKFCRDCGMRKVHEGKEA